MERHPGKAYIRMGIVLGTVKGRDLSERLLPRQRGAIRGQVEHYDEPFVSRRPASRTVSTAAALAFDPAVYAQVKKLSRAQLSAASI